MGLRNFLRNHAPRNPGSESTSASDRGGAGKNKSEKMGNSAASSVILQELPSESVKLESQDHLDSNGDLTAVSTSTGNTTPTPAAAQDARASRKSHRAQHSRVASRRSRPGGPQHRHRGVFSGVAHAVGKLGHAVEHALVPPMTSSHHHHRNKTEQHLPRIKVLLRGCRTPEQHRQFIATLLECCRDLHGREGLRAVGFDYKLVPCLEHRPDSHADTDQEEKKSPETETRPTSHSCSSPARLERLESWQDSPSSLLPAEPCTDCATRLYHVDSGTLINEENRQLYIADGEMYEALARLCQEFAQEVMQEEGNLEWVTVCDDENESEPIRALVHIDHHLASGSSDLEGGLGDDPDARPILLVVTGKGKVRAGIFSRQHLMTTGLEPATAVPMVREAARREMSIIILDPNARGDRRGMDTFEKSVELLLGHLEQQSTTEHESSRSIYVVAHSASGSHLVRYLLDRVHIYSPYLKAVAFTDSTHNIQWARDNAELRQLLGSSQCVYFRSANEHRDTHWHTRRAGEEAETDHFWTHRFGGIRTRWAGTKEHSLTNWFAHSHIWDHFDSHMLVDSTEGSRQELT